MRWDEDDYSSRTEYDCHVVLRLDHQIQHLPVDVLDRVLQLLVDEPLEDLVLVQQVALEYGRDLVLKVDQWREVDHAEFLGELRVHDFDKVDADLVRVVVDRLKAVEDLVARLTIFLGFLKTWKSHIYIILNIPDIDDSEDHSYS